MDYDFTKTLYKDEQILWQGESSPNAPDADKYRRRSNRALGILMLVFGAFLIAAGIANRYTGYDLAGTILLAAFFVMVGIIILKTTAKYVQESYCLTDKRLLIKRDKEYLQQFELYNVQCAEVTGRNGEYGSIILFTESVNINQYKRQCYDRNHSRPTKDEIGCIRGVREYDKLCDVINNASASLYADRENQIQLALQREYADPSYMSDEEDAFRMKLKKRYEKMQKRAEKLERKNK